jgi:hypothetical protein
METAKAWDCPRCDQVNEPTKPICDCGFNIKSVDEGAVANMRKKRGNKLIILGLFPIAIGAGIFVATVFGESHYFFLPWHNRRWLLNVCLGFSGKISFLILPRVPTSA